MASLQTSFHSGSKTNSALNPLPSSPVPTKEKPISPDMQDIWCEVKDKLTAVTDFFNLYESLEFYDKPVSLRKRTLGGVIHILDDCIDRLDPLFQDRG
jgi:hypothetical protein